MDSLPQRRYAVRGSSEILLFYLRDFVFDTVDSWICSLPYLLHIFYLVLVLCRLVVLQADSEKRLSHRLSLQSL